MRVIMFVPESSGQKYTGISPNAGLQDFDGFGTYTQSGNNYSMPITFMLARNRTFTATGWISYDTDGLFEETARYQVEEYPEYGLNPFKNDWWKFSGISRTVPKVKTENIINKLLKNNQYIFENNLLLARFANKLNSSEKQNLYYLQKRLEQRDNMLREADVFSQMQEARIMGYSNYENNLVQFMTSYQQGVGVVISTTTAIIIAVVVIGSLSTAAYYAFKAAYEESNKDVELSRKMLEIFEKYQMSEEDIATIQKETQGIVTKRVLMEKINTTFGNIKNILLYGALGYIGYQLYKKYKK